MQETLPGLEIKQSERLVDAMALRAVQEILPYLPSEQETLPTEEE